MKHQNPLLAGVEECWKRLASAWTKAESGLNTRSVHRMRVATRRLVASLTVLHAILNNDRILRVRRQFEKLQKQLGPLRDVQVQLSTVEARAQSGDIRTVESSLKRLEAKKARRMYKHLGGQRKLHDRLKAMEKSVAFEMQDLPLPVINQRVREALQAGCDEVDVARKNLESNDPASLHKLRVVVKKLRYLLERAQPILGAVPKERIELLRSYQRQLGDIRDLQLLEGKLDHWSKKCVSRERPGIIKFQQSLTRRRTRQMKKFLLNPSGVLELQLHPPQPAAR